MRGVKSPQDKYFLEEIFLICNVSLIHILSLFRRVLIIHIYLILCITNTYCYPILMHIVKTYINPAVGPSAVPNLAAWARLPFCSKIWADFEAFLAG